MVFKKDQEVRIKNTKEILGKIVELRDSGPKSGDMYLVDVCHRRLVLRASSIEELDEGHAETGRLQAWTPEWITEAQKVPALLKAALDNPDDLKIRQAAIEAMERLDWIVPITSNPED